MPESDFYDRSLPFVLAWLLRLHVRRAKARLQGIICCRSAWVKRLRMQTSMYGEIRQAFCPRRVKSGTFEPYRLGVVYALLTDGALQIAPLSFTDICHSLCFSILLYSDIRFQSNAKQSKATQSKANKIICSIFNILGRGVWGGEPG